MSHSANLESTIKWGCILAGPTASSSIHSHRPRRTNFQRAAAAAVLARFFPREFHLLRGGGKKKAVGLRE